MGRGDRANLESSVRANFPDLSAAQVTRATEMGRQAVRIAGAIGRLTPAQTLEEATGGEPVPASTVRINVAIEMNTPTGATIWRTIRTTMNWSDTKGDLLQAVIEQIASWMERYPGTEVSRAEIKPPTLFP